MKTNLRSVLKISLLLALLLALGLSACGSGNTANTAPPEVVETEEVVEDSDVDPLVRGQELYSGLCIACHGPTAEGVTGLGKNLHVSEFFADSSDEELVAFVSEGRPASDPANTTGVDMPPRGGNPNLTDEDLAAIVTYLRTLTE
ncbi:MAG: cytochrome c [Chloroflexota bacterium]